MRLNEYIKPKPVYVNLQVFDDSIPPNYITNVPVWLGLNDVEPKHTEDFSLVRFEILCSAETSSGTDLLTWRSSGNSQIVVS
jgi:hypothetical protein